MIVLVALTKIPGPSIREGYHFAFRIAAVLTGALLLWKDVDKWVGCFLLLALFSHSFPMFYITGRLLDTPQAYRALNVVIFGCLYYAVIVRHCGNVNSILNALCVIAIINCIVLATQAYNYDIFRLVGMYSNIAKGTGFMANRNESSALMALCFPAFLRPAFAGPYWCWLFPIPFIGVLLAYSLNGLLAITLIFGIFLIYKRHAWDLALFTCTGLLAAYYHLGDVPAITRRFNVWRAALSLVWKHNPLIGCGLGNWARIYPGLVKAGKIENGFIRLHNTHVHAYVEMGVGYVILLLTYVVHVIRRLRRTHFIPLAGLLAVAVVSSTNSVLRMNTLNAMLVITWLALFARQWKQQPPTIKEKHNGNRPKQSRHPNPRRMRRQRRNVSH